MKTSQVDPEKQRPRSGHPRALKLVVTAGRLVPGQTLPDQSILWVRRPDWQAHGRDKIWAIRLEEEGVRVQGRPSSFRGKAPATQEGCHRFCRALYRAGAGKGPFEGYFWRRIGRLQPSFSSPILSASS